MTTRRKLLWGGLAIWLIPAILLAVIVGSHGKNNTFKIQNEFKLINWVHLGVFSINRAVLYLFIAAILTMSTRHSCRVSCCRRCRSSALTSSTSLA